MKIIYLFLCVYSKSSLETHLFTNIVQDEGPAMKRLLNGVLGFGNGTFLKVTEGEKCFNDIVKKYGHSNTKDILIKKLLQLLKWNKL